MVEKVKTLKSQREHAILPMVNARAFHDREVRRDVPWPAKPVASLGEINQWTVAHARRTQMAGIESGLATRLHK